MKLASQQKDYIKTVSHKKKGLHQFYISYTIALEKAMDYKIIYDVTTAVKKYSAAVKHNIYMKKCWEEKFPSIKYSYGN